MPRAARRVRPQRAASDGGAGDEEDGKKEERGRRRRHSAAAARPAAESVCSSPSLGLSSSGRPACRICSIGEDKRRGVKTGPLIQPCRCTGTLAHVHEMCLNKWISVSGKWDRCEICRTPYKVVGYSFRPLRQWTRPAIGCLEMLRTTLLVSMVFSTFYLASLISERHTFKRIADPRASITVDSYFTFALMVLTLSLWQMLMWHSLLAACNYGSRQRARRFGNFKPKPQNLERRVAAAEQRQPVDDNN